MTIDVLFIILGALVAYLLGSIPTAVWYGKAFHGVDVRQHGSGNAGATNTFRVLGKTAGIIVLLIDVLKGFVATEWAWLMMDWKIVQYDNLFLYKLVFYKLIFGTLAVVGHIFPVYAGFKGGKGVATLLGMMLAVDYQTTLMSVGVFLVVLLVFQYVSLGSMLAALSFPLLLLVPRFKPDDPAVVVFGFLMFLVVVITHQKNITKLLNGEENKARLWRRRG
jgi:acyl phosphate:glycerol-3-phosphate acyltransferase